MRTDIWKGTGDWNLNPADWSLGAPPTASTPAEIQSGTAAISTSGVAEWLTIDSGATLNLDNGATLTLTDWLNIAGAWDLGGGDTVTIGGRLTNSGAINIGNTSIAASTKVTAAGLQNTSAGTLVLQGNAGAGATDQATLDISGTSSAVVSGSLRVLGDADLELATGITTVSSTGFLQIDGAEARISLGAGTTSNALSGLDYNAGTIDFEGNSALGYGGTTIKTTVQFTNARGAKLSVDNGLLAGGSVVTFGGTLTNDGALEIGNGELSASTTVKATALANNGSVFLQGNASSETSNKASLILSGAAPSTLTGVFQVEGDAALQFASGGITTVGSGAFLELNGAGAKILTGGGVSALSGLTANYGSLTLSFGASLTTTTSFTNILNAFASVGGGGSAATFGGALTNDGELVIGNTALGASTTVKATTLVNNGTLLVEGNSASGTTDKASLILSGAAPLTSTGLVFVSGDATLQFGSGGITTVGSGASLELDGAGAQILTGGGASALSGLATNNGTLTLDGDSSAGAGGVTLATTTGFANYLSANVDASSGDGGSALTFGGALTNDGTLDIGNTGLSVSTTVNAMTLVNNRTLVLQGNAASGTSDKASLILSSGVAPATLTGHLQVAGDATLQFASGAITTVGSEASLELDGAQAKILTGGGASALSGLTANDGYLYLTGDSSSGAGGATLTTTKAFTNYGYTYVDNSSDSGGSTATFGGRLTNDGTLDIGNAGLSAASTVTAKSLNNAGTLALAGSSGFLAELVVNGAATTSGAMTIGAGAELDVTGSNSFTQAAGSTTVTGSLAASTIDANDGLLDFAGAITGGDGVGALNIGDLGTLEFSAAVDNTHTVDFTAADGNLALSAPSAFDGSIKGFAGADDIDLLGQAITKLSYSGSSTLGALTVTGSSGTIATLAFNGDYKTTSFTFASDGHGGSDILHT